MPTSVSYPYLKVSTKLCAALLLIAICFSNSGTSQTTLPKQRPNVRLANDEHKNIPVKTILANPKLASAKPSCEVTSFVISFLPEGGRTYGPFSTEGNSLTRDQVKYLKEMSNTNVKITIEQIHMSCNGKDVTEPPIKVTSFP